MSEKLKDLKKEIEDMAANEKQIRNRIQELKSLVVEKQRRKESLEAMKKEEDELMKQLGL